jgi:predicted ATP-binding protein involved in virulence
MKKMAENLPYPYIDQFRAQNFFSIEDIEMNDLADKKEIYLLGENGDGKSLILMAMVLAFRGRFIFEETDFKETGLLIDMMSAKQSMKLGGKDAKRQIYSIIEGGNSSVSQKATFNSTTFLAYGVHRSRNDSERSSEHGFLTLFDENQVLKSPEQWLKKLYTQKLEYETGKKTIPFNKINLEIAQNILKDILDKNVNIEVSSEGVKYTERGTILKFNQLSEGYKSVIVWVCDMVSRLTSLFKGGTEIQDCRGIVLVDEINLHLHPKWEKQLARKLRAWFPEVQFVFTTHSPVTILGASDDAVFYRVFKKNGKTCLSEPFFKRDMKDLTANTVLTSPLFGLGDARMDNGDNLSKANLDTSDDFLSSRIHAKIAAIVEQKKKNGTTFLTTEEIDAMIEAALNEELVA